MKNQRFSPLRQLSYWRNCIKQDFSCNFSIKGIKKHEEIVVFTQRQLIPQVFKLYENDGCKTYICL